MKLLFGALILFLGTLFSAQKHEFLDVPKFNDADLTKEKSLIDEKAPAEVLYRSLHYWIDMSTGFLMKNIYYRVKIYDKDKAEDWLNVEIPVWESKSGSRETLNSMKGYVYNMENGQKTETKVDKSSKFKSKENKYVTINKFAFPNVKNGSVIEYKYEIASPFLYEIPLIFIELKTPSVYTEYVLDSPVNVSYSVDYTGSLTPKYRDIKETTLYGSSYRTYRFGYDNIPAFKEEKFVKNSDNYRTKIRAELHSTNFNNQLRMFSSSWEEIRKKLYDDDDFGGELKKGKITKELIPASVLSAKTSLEKANIIFNYVQKNYTWNGDYGIYTDKGIRGLLNDKTGNDAEINLLLITMLREAGLNADPVLISTVENGMVNTTFPNVGNFNYILAALDVNGELHLFDATSKQSSDNLLPPRDWNELGVLFSDKKASILNIFISKMSYNYMDISAKINDDGSISGSYTDKDTGLYAMRAKEHFDENTDKYKNSYKETFAVDFSDINSSVLENNDFESKMNFSSNNMMDVVGKKIIINPILFLNKTNNEFDQTEERLYPIDFYTPYTRVKKVELEIPEGYKVETLPKSKKIATEDREIEYSYIVESSDRKVVVTATTKVGSDTYPKEYYPAFKQVWKTIIDSQNQVLSLVKE